MNQPIQYNQWLSLLLAWAGPLLVFGQTTPLNEVQRQISAYTNRTLQEKIFVHLDRPLYVVGETLWFKAYCVDAGSLRPSAVSQIAYLELLDQESTPVAQTKLTLTNGKGQGHLRIPATLASGTYTVRCYTNWMKNFSPELYFEAPVTLRNPFVLPESPPVTSGPTPAYDVQFFPEGGNLVSTLDNKVAFRAIGKDGRGIDFTGTLVNQHNDTLLRFQPQRFGIGTFTFTPAQGDRYRAVLQDAQGTTLSYPLSAPQAQGYVMHVSDAGQVLKVTVQGNGDASASPTVSLLAHSAQGSTRAETGTLTKGKAVFELNKSDLGDGITRLTLFDHSTRPVAERLYFKRPAGTFSISSIFDKPDYTTREKVRLDLSTPALASETADLSVAVYLIDSLPTISQPTIESYLLLTSELKGTVESPASYLAESGAAADEALDNIMLTHGWSRYAWDDIGTSGKTAYRFLPEKGGHFIKGKVYDPLTRQPVRDVSVFLASPDLHPKLFLTQSDSLGNLRFEVKKLYDTHDVIVQLDPQRDTTYRVELSNPYSERFSGRRWPQGAGPGLHPDQLLTRSINMQTQNAFMNRPVIPPGVTGVDTLAFFGKPDEKYFLDAYTRFPTMEEVMREYVSGVFVKRQQKKFHFAVIDNVTPQGGVFNQDPLILLDGVPVFDTDKIMAFDPLKIKKLEVIDGLYYLGARSFPGVVSYSTYKGDLAGFELDPRALVVSYDFAQSKKEFYAPRYDAAESRSGRLPDFRNLLYWSPALPLDAQGKRSVDFYTSDQTGTYRVVVQGITTAGKAGSHEATFEVKPGGRQ